MLFQKLRRAAEHIRVGRLSSETDVKDNSEVQLASKLHFQLRLNNKEFVQICSYIMHEVWDVHVGPFKNDNHMEISYF